MEHSRQVFSLVMATNISILVIFVDRPRNSLEESSHWAHIIDKAVDRFTS